MKPAGPRVILPNTRRRDTLASVSVGLALLVAMIFGINHLSKPYQSLNILLGVVVAKEFNPQREEQVSFQKSRVAASSSTDGEYLLQVRVEKEARTYAVPVEKAVYERKPLGAELKFVRPPSEQRQTAKK